MMFMNSRVPLKRSLSALAACVICIGLTACLGDRDCEMNAACAAAEDDTSDNDLASDASTSPSTEDDTTDELDDDPMDPSSVDPNVTITVNPGDPMNSQGDAGVPEDASVPEDPDTSADASVPVIPSTPDAGTPNTECEVAVFGTSLFGQACFAP